MIDFIKSSMMAMKPDDYNKGWIDTNGKKTDVLIQKSLVDENDDINWSADLEETHEESTQNSWIDVYERDRVIDALSDIVSRIGKNELRLIEFGSSTGYMIQDIKNSFPDMGLIATDLYAEGLHKSYKRNPDIYHVQCDNTDAPFEDETMDIIVSLNVLEHIEDDEKAISECHRILKTGGYAVFVVPRGDKLYDYYDEALYHKRRYANGELKRKCETAGFRVVFNSHLASLIYPAFWLKKKWNRYHWKKGFTYEESMEKTEKDIDNVKDSKIAIMISNVESRLYKRIAFKQGIREIVVVRKG